MRWVALLRAVNVGGTGKIEMARLRAAAEAAGLDGVQSYIASGNLVFSGSDDEAEVRQVLTGAITGEFGWCPGLLMRSGAEMAAVQARDPFPEAEGSKVLVLFVDGDISTDDVRHQSDEQIVPGEREMFIHFPTGMGRSRLVIPSAKFYRAEYEHGGEAGGDG